MKILLRGFQNSNSIKCITIDESQIKTFEQLSTYLSSPSEHNPSQGLNFSCNGINKRQEEEIQFLTKVVYDVKTVEIGGKGGFGSLLKGQPPVKKRTNNFDSCRDLSGRRIRHLNQEKLLREWQTKKMEEDKIIKMYNNPEENKKVDDYVDSDKKNELVEMNRKYLRDACKSTDLIVKSVKFVLKKKRSREEVKSDNVEKNNLVTANRPSSLNNVGTIINQNKFGRNKKLEIDDIIDGEDCDFDEKKKEDMEKKLFSLD